MALIVQKFGGTSVGSVERIKEVTKIIATEQAKGNKVIVVVSAMTGVTNQLVTLCNEVSKLKNRDNLAEYDSALSSGEIVSAALLALALQENNISSRSITAWQLPIFTNSHYSSSLVDNLDCSLIYECLERSIVPIITGFQGITKDGRITTLGRGGSDTTAALIAAAIKARSCDIYTDVDGIYSADPRIVHDAKLLNNIYNLEMLEFAAAGAKVLHARSVEIAIRYNVPLKIISSFTNKAGTLITSDKKMEAPLITGVTYNKNLLKITIKPNNIDHIELLSILTRENINIESFVNVRKDFQLIIPLNYESMLQNILLTLKEAKKIYDFNIDSKIAIVSVVGFGVKNNPQIFTKILEKLAKINIKSNMISISEIKISILVEEALAEQCVKLLHSLI